MSPACLEMVAIVTAAFLTGITVKIMDDYLDDASDSISGQTNLISLYGKGIVIYGFCSLIAAAAIHLPTAISVFATSYVIGMGFSTSSIYLLGMSGRVEGLFMLVFSVIFAGMSYTAVNLCMIAAIQLWDNWIDSKRDPIYLAIAIGCIGCALLIDGRYASMVLFAYGVFFALERWWLHSIS